MQPNSYVRNLMNHPTASSGSLRSTTTASGFWADAFVNLCLLIHIQNQLLHNFPMTYIFNLDQSAEMGGWWWFRVPDTTVWACRTPLLTKAWCCVWCVQICVSQIVGVMHITVYLVVLTCYHFMSPLLHMLSSELYLTTQDGTKAEA